MSTSRKRLLIIACILFFIYGILGVIGAVTAFPDLAIYDRTYAASLPWAVYYGLMLVGSLIYLILGICGIIYQKNKKNHTLLKALCFGALVYILMGTILWFGVYARVYEWHIAIAILEIALGLVPCFILLFSISGQNSQ